MKSVVHFSTECSTTPDEPSGKMASGNNAIISNFEENQPKVSLYPNPASKFINVDIDGIEAADIFITNVNGQEIYHGEILKGTKQINLPPTAPGIYLVRIRAAGVNVVKKIQIQ